MLDGVEPVVAERGVEREREVPRVEDGDVDDDRDQRPAEEAEEGAEPVPAGKPDQNRARRDEHEDRRPEARTCCDLHHAGTLAEAIRKTSRIREIR